MHKVAHQIDPISFYAKQFKEDPHTKKSFQIKKIGKVGVIAFKRRKMGKNY